jgi:hypothetical protein
VVQFCPLYLPVRNEKAARERVLCKGCHDEQPHLYLYLAGRKPTDRTHRYRLYCFAAHMMRCECLIMRSAI